MAQLQHSDPSAQLAEYASRSAPPVPSGRSATIFRKEIREILRDRRTMFGAVVSPLVIVPLIIWASSFFMHLQQVKEAKKVYTVGIVGGGNLPDLTRALGSSPNLKLLPTTGAAAQSAVAAHKLGCSVQIPDDAAAKIKSGGTAGIIVLLDSANDVSNGSAARIEAAVQAYAKTIRMHRLASLRLTRDFDTPLDVTEQSVKGGGSPIMLLLSVLLPYFLTLNALTGGMYAANDQIAGEKERGTLETLLVSPASRLDIVLGKFWAVACVCMLSGILSVFGMALPFVARLPGMAMLGGSGRAGSMHIGIETLACILLAQVPLALLCAGVLVAVSTIARNQKEVQVYQTPLVLAVVLPALASLSISSDVPATYALVPVLNSALVIKQSLAGSIQPLFLCVALVSAFLYAALAVAISVRLFLNEKILLKT